MLAVQRLTRIVTTEYGLHHIAANCVGLGV